MRQTLYRLLHHSDASFVIGVLAFAVLEAAAVTVGLP